MFENSADDLETTETSAEGNADDNATDWSEREVLDRESNASLLEDSIGEITVSSDPTMVCLAFCK